MDKVKEILTKYWVGILCGVVALVAIIASFVPLGGYHDELKKKLTDSAGTYNQLNQLLTAHRLKPKKFEDVEQPELTQFPSQSIIDSGKDLVKRLEEESKNAMKTVVDANRHAPLVPGVLPNPILNGPFQYREAYNKRLNPNDGALLAAEVLHATMPPTAQQMADEKKRRWDADYKTKLIPDPANPSVNLNQDQVDRDYAQAMEKLPSEMRSAAATSSKVYMSPGVLTMDMQVQNRQALPPTPQVIWWSQMALWVQEDVCQAIAEANKDAKDVTGARVKRLLTLNVPIGPQMIFGRTLSTSGSGMGAADPNAAAPAANPNEEVKLVYGGTSSGRVSCGLYDVVQYQVEMIVSAKELPAVLAAFSDNRLVTVLNVESCIAEDGAAAAKDGFLFGNEPVVRVMLRCESLFLREWTVPLMPEAIKTMLGVPKPAAPTP